MITAQVVAELMAAGLTGEALIAALHRIEEASQSVTKTSPGALRTQRWRERKAASQTVTNRHGDVTGDNVLMMEDNNTNPPISTAKPKASRGTRLPEGWAPPDAEVVWALAEFPSLDKSHLNAITDEFCDYWAGVPGQRGLKLDWPKTWRNRVREKATRGGRNVVPMNGGGYSPSTPLTTETRAEYIQRISRAK